MAKQYVGTGWSNKYGVAISIKRDAIAALPVNKWGEVRLFVGERREKDERSKATHYVAVEEERPALAQDSIPENVPDLPF